MNYDDQISNRINIEVVLLQRKQRRFSIIPICFVVFDNSVYKIIIRFGVILRGRIPDQLPSLFGVTISMSDGGLWCRIVTFHVFHPFVIAKIKGSRSFISICIASLDQKSPKFFPFEILGYFSLLKYAFSLILATF